MDKDTRIAVVGGGLAGLTLAGLLHKQGHRVSVFEQSSLFHRIGAGIILGASIAKVIQRIGILEPYIASGMKPDAFVSRKWDTGEVLNELLFDAEAETRFGGPFINIHRADLHDVLRSAIPDEAIHFDHTLVGAEPHGSVVRLTFSNGQTEDADIVVGADGIHSRLRDAIFGTRPLRYVGSIAYRSVFPTSRAAGLSMRDCTKWWGPDRHALSYYVTGRRDEMYIMGAVPDTSWDASNEPVLQNHDQFLDAFKDFHPELTTLIKAADEVQVLPICDLERNDTWSQGQVVLMGDACHAVRPYMAAGGSMAIEDAAILAEAIGTHNTPQKAFAAYETIRIPRVGEVQRISEENSWLKLPTDTGWFFGYDPFTEDLKRAA
jgi:6-hydroxynicotinate 3-monooxygenase